MLKYTFLSNPTSEQLGQIILLYQGQDWLTQEEADNPELVVQLIAGSHCFIVATDDDEIIGMGRGISDGVSDAYIQDVTVREAYRGQGIGTGIVSAVLDRLRADNMKWIGLIAERSSDEFYKGLGFKEMPNATPMIIEVEPCKT